MQINQSKIEATTWPAILWRQVRAFPLTALGAVIACVMVLVFFLQRMTTLTVDHPLQTIKFALAGGGAGFFATAIGALPALLIQKVRQQTEDMMLGFAAGMMLAAAAFSLILPGIEAGKELTQSPFAGVTIVVVGLALGVIFMLGMERFIPHEHEKAGAFGPGPERCNRVWLFVLAIALHNLPEGMAIGVGFAQGDLSVGLPLSAAIAIQDIPEGLAVALTLRSIGRSPLFSVVVAGLTGLLEPLGAFIGVGLSGGLALSYPLGLGLSAGAMLFVVSHEVIPETHRNGHQTLATIGLMIGFALMMVLDTALG